MNTNFGIGGDDLALVMKNMLSEMRDLTGEVRYSEFVHAYAFGLIHGEPYEVFSKAYAEVTEYVDKHMTLATEESEVYLTPKPRPKIETDEYRVLRMEYTVEQFHMPVHERNEDWMLTDLGWWRFLGYLTALLDVGILAPTRFEAIKMRTPLADVNINELGLPRIDMNSVRKSTC